MLCFDHIPKPCSCLQFELWRTLFESITSVKQQRKMSNDLSVIHFQTLRLSQGKCSPIRWVPVRRPTNSADVCTSRGSHSSPRALQKLLPPASLKYLTSLTSSHNFKECFIKFLRYFAWFVWFLFVLELCHVNLEKTDADLPGSGRPKKFPTPFCWLKRSVSILLASPKRRRPRVALYLKWSLIDYVSYDMMNQPWDAFACIEELRSPAWILQKVRGLKVLWMQSATLESAKEL